MKEHEKREAEIASFFSCLEEATQDNNNAGVKHIHNYIEYKKKVSQVAFLYCSTVVLQLLCMIYKAYDCFANELVTEILPSQYSTAQGMLIPLFRVMPRQCCSFRDSSRETRDVLVETDTCLVSREKKCQYLAFKDLL